jgi:isopenicillin-N epimerase
VSDGTGLRGEFLLDPDVTFLNHGSFGACPRAVFERYQEWQLELEREPVLFLARRLEGLLAEARASLGAYVGADPDDLVFVPNATSGVNIAAWPLGLQAGDEVLATNLEYGALDLTWEHVCGDFGARYVRTPVPLPIGEEDEVVETIWAGVNERTRVLYVSHHTSGTALTLPVAELCRRARERGIVTVIDGAHVPGHLPLNIRELDPDFYAGNCHKWLCAPKGSGFLYVRPQAQALLEPQIVSWDSAADAWADRFRWTGTRDPSAHLAVGAAIDFQAEHDWASVRERCHALAGHAAQALCERLGTEPFPAHDGEFVQMVTVRLPPCDADALGLDLARRHRIEVVAQTWHGEPTLRVSFQGYNEENDLDKLLRALSRLLAPSPLR